jgi:predicted amidohydrolase
MQIALAQLNTIVGDVDGNVTRLLDAAARAQKERADIVVFPELCVSGYPPRDLVERAAFIRQCEAGLERIRAATAAPGMPAIIAGLPLPSRATTG